MTPNKESLEKAKEIVDQNRAEYGHTHEVNLEKDIAIESINEILGEK